MRKCYFCCGYDKCYCCRCCECITCCSCIPISKCCKEKENLSEVINQDENICVIYKIKGFCSYIFDYFSDCAFMFSIIVLLLVKLLNFGFNITLQNYINTQNETENGKINLTFLGGIILYYLLNLFLGYLYFNKLPLFGIFNKGESSYIGLGLIPLVFFINLFCLLFSILIYYDIANEVSKFYLMSLSKSGVEYFHLMMTNFIFTSHFNNNDGIEILSYSTFASFFLLFYNIFISLLGNFKINEKSLILIQFIINFVTFLVNLFYNICICFYQNVRYKNSFRF